MEQQYLSRETLTQQDREELEKAIAAPVKTDTQEAIIRARSAYLTHAERSDLDAILNQKVPYMSMTKNDLLALAAERKIEISSANTKAEIVAALEAAEDGEEEDKEDGE